MFSSIFIRWTNAFRIKGLSPATVCWWPYSYCHCRLLQDSRWTDISFDSTEMLRCQVAQSRNRITFHIAWPMLLHLLSPEDRGHFRALRGFRQIAFDWYHALLHGRPVILLGFCEWGQPIIVYSISKIIGYMAIILWNEGCVCATLKFDWSIEPKENVRIIRLLTGKYISFRKDVTITTLFTGKYISFRRGVKRKNLQKFPCQWLPMRWALSVPSSAWF